MGLDSREQLVFEGVDSTGVKSDPHRLAALFLPGIREETQFLLIFYRTDSAGLVLCEV